MNKNQSQIDPRVLRTRKLIKDAFVNLLEDIDVEKMTVSKIAEKATISRVAFYHHYQDIPDMLEKMADDMAEEIHGIISRYVDDNRDNADELMLISLLEFIAKHAAFYKVTLGSRKAPIFTERLSDKLTEMITMRKKLKQGNKSRTQNEIPMDIATWYGTSALIGTIVSWLRNDMPYTPQYLAKQFYLLTLKLNR
ncbi:TetR/AcrR family transcriptional regulator C-terminal domain-containing protein [Terribacillus goriensis]|uniref:TetR/AcrR family transcriptional regulator n=1 Tax=Terribacillus saccharophilus TaxID=361277 RepID=UPI0039837E47